MGWVTSCLLFHYGDYRPKMKWLRELMKLSVGDLYLCFSTLRDTFLPFTIAGRVCVSQLHAYWSPPATRLVKTHRKWKKASKFELTLDIMICENDFVMAHPHIPTPHVVCANWGSCSQHSISLNPSPGSTTTPACISHCVTNVSVETQSFPRKNNRIGHPLSTNWTVGA